MPRILIAGCGYVGQATAGLFHAAGWDVEGWTASEESAAALSANRIVVARSIFQTVIRSQSAPEHSMLLFTVRVREAAESSLTGKSICMEHAICSIDLLKQFCFSPVVPAFMRNAMARG